jgi:acetolactate synthase I/III small subunit
VFHLSSNPMVARELAFIKVKVEPSKRPEIFGVVDTFRASVIDIGPNNLIIQVVGELSKIEAMVEL